MGYTVKKLAHLSGVSIRTLHFYDEIGLLKPAYHGENGYRYYEEEQLLLLQQILFFRELGFELKKIQKILGRSNFDKIEALLSHRKVLHENGERMVNLVQTIDKTIKHLRGETKMQDQDMYHGFSKEKQEEYEKYLINRFGDAMHERLSESHKNSKNWSKTDWEAAGKEFDGICKELAKMMHNHYAAGSSEAQKIVSKHYEWLKKFWTPDKDSYISLGEMYTGFEWKKGFEAHDPKHPTLARFLADGMQVFADKHLT